MSDEEIVRAFLGDGVYQDDEGLDYVNRSGHEALSRILSERDSLRAALERAGRIANPELHAIGSTRSEMVDAFIAIEDLTVQALTSSEKDRGPMVMQQLQQTTSSDATLRGTSSEKEKADG